MEFFSTLDSNPTLVVRAGSLSSGRSYTFWMTATDALGSTGYAGKSSGSMHPTVSWGVCRYRATNLESEVRPIQPTGLESVSHQVIQEWYLMGSSTRAGMRLRRLSVLL